jgi:N-dimethylarginine dimethylaminohydrolase
MGVGQMAGMAGGFGHHSSDYGKLRQVVVGSADDLTIPPFSPALVHYNPELKQALIANDGKPLDIRSAFPERFERTVEQLDSLADIYEKRGIEVLRTRPYTEAEKGYLGFLQGGHHQLYPADPVFVLGNHYLEVNIRRAYRRKEVFPLRDLVMPLIEADPEARHVATPSAQPFTPSGEGAGPFLEGGDFIVIGKDIILGESHIASNRAGTHWLKRYIEPFGYDVHPMPMVGDLPHALGAMCVLREGLLMAYLPALAEGLPEPVRDWEVIALTEHEAQTFATVGVSLDERTYVMPAGNNRVVDELDKRGIEPITIPYEDVSFRGGSVRCSTLPLARD